VPSAPRRPAAALAAVLGFALGSCTESRSPTTPSQPMPTTTPMPPFTLSGVVFEHLTTEVRPLAHARIRVRTTGGVILEGTANTAGRYEISGVPADAMVIEPSTDTEYRAPCPPGVLGSNNRLDVHVVSTALLSTLGTPSSLPTGSIWVSGTVFERTSEGMRPIAGASVALAADDSDRLVVSSTLTDEAGRYLVCPVPPGAGTDQVAWVRVRKENYPPTSRRVFLGWDYVGADIELSRNLALGSVNPAQRRLPAIAVATQ